MVDSLLQTLESPLDIKGLSYERLLDLCAEIRHRIIDVMSVNGGHLASGLGAVELTVALHRVFDTPIDKLIWDVGHQTYPHKLLTGRNAEFGTVRQFKGLCGFTHPMESEYDHFYSGHAGPALSLALGVAASRDLNSSKEHVIPVIGDATLTCGLALEALNNMPKDLRRFIVVLNDNKMSISKNVGRITHILSRLLNNPTLARFHHDVDSLIEKLPYGEFLARQGHKLAESAKNLVSPAVFFEHYGLSYIGPIDGHDLDSLISTFEGLRDCTWPTLVHVITNKGQGLAEAVKDPTLWHGAKPFDVQSCKFLPVKSSKPTFPSVFGKHLLTMCEADDSILTVTPAMSAGSCLDALMAKYPERCLDVGIAESHAVSFCGGLAYQSGKKVFCSIYASFLQRGFDNLFHDVCLQQLPVVFAIDRAGIAGGDGATHNGIYDIAFLNAMPNMVITQPRNGQVLKALMQSAHGWSRPTAIRYPNVPTDELEGVVLKDREVGKGEILAQGLGLLIIGVGVMCETAMQVRDALAERGIRATVVDPVFVKPLDTELFDELLAKHDKIVTIEEHSVVSGFGAIFNNWLMQRGYGKVSVLNCGVPETFVEHGARGLLLEELELSAEKILMRIDRHFVFAGQGAQAPVGLLNE